MSGGYFDSQNLAVMFPIPILLPRRNVPPAVCLRDCERRSLLPARSRHMIIAKTGLCSSTDF